MIAKAVTDIFHARLHLSEKRIFFPGKMTVPEFIEANKELCNEIAKYLKETYNIELSNSLNLMSMRDGIKQYLIAEGMYKG